MWETQRRIVSGRPPLPAHRRREAVRGQAEQQKIAPTCEKTVRGQVHLWWRGEMNESLRPQRIGPMRTLFPGNCPLTGSAEVNKGVSVTGHG